ncbi:MAG: AMP-binding protein [Acidimicrobiales bacterium]|nr:AMP-binding protein [Acidimicrobiales bacterium]
MTAEQGPTQWALTAVHDVVAEAAPDRDMVICGSVRRSFGEVRDRSRGLASFLVGAGLGVRRERADLEPWESGQDMVALVLHNSAEYLEAMLGVMRARAVPFNVNHHYRPGEVGDLLVYVGTSGIVYHRRYAPLLAKALGEAGIQPSSLVLVHVEDGTDEAPLPGSTSYDDAVAVPVGDLPEPSPDDLYAVCTGGTTGRPKAVLWRQADIYVAGMAGSSVATTDSITEAVLANPANPWFAMPPLMHAASQWTAFAGFINGSPVLLHDDSGAFDARAVLEAIERDRAHMMSMVGDAHGRPLVEEMRRRSYDLSSLKMVGTGGAITTEPVKQALIELLPDILIMDGYGSSEVGSMAFGPRTAAGGASSFQPGAGATVVSADLSRELEAGDDEVGWMARGGAVPLGYLGDRVKTEATFPLVAGQRMAVPGDRARRLADGTLELLGRDSMVVNTGGEKVFVEEVESTLLEHPGITDALVVGRASERFGQEVVAVVSLRPGTRLEPSEVRSFVADRIARFKAPRAVLVCDQVRRHANGKADYRWALSVADEAVEATGAG